MLSFDSYEHLKFEQQGGVLTVLISNPEGRNCVNERLHHELSIAFRAIHASKDVRVVVLTGDPAGYSFCAGGDLKWLQSEARSTEGFGEILEQGVEIVNSLLDIRQPVIAKVNGAAIGLGATLALCADVCFAATDAIIADPHVGVGVVAGDGGALLWPLLIGPNRAKEFLMTGNPLSGEEAERIGLINHAVPGAQLDDAVNSLANQLSNGPRFAIEWTKKSVNLLMRQLGAQLLPASLALEGLTFNTADHREAVEAFLSKRRPTFERE